MPKPKKTKNPIDADTVRGMIAGGMDSHVATLRLQYMEYEGIARYLRGMVGKERVYPRMTPTQASGRWSTTNPPLVNFPVHTREECDRCTDLPEHEWCPRDARGVILPDPGTYWVHGDLDAIEGRFCAAYSRDQEELDAYRFGYDIHTINACHMFGRPLPPILTKQCHTAPECDEWRQGWTPAWGGSSDRRRHLAKTLKYATQFARDHRGVNSAKDVEKLGLEKKEVERFAKMYLAAKLILTAHKARKFEEYARTNVSYTFRGRRRRLFGDAVTRAKEGWSHEVQGSVPDIMNDYIIQIAQALPEGWLILNAHDGVTWAMPDSHPVEHTVQTIKGIVHRDWDLHGVLMPVTGEWEVLYPDGTSHRV